MIAILGASGFIGSLLVEALSSRRKELLGIDIVKPRSDYNWLIADMIEPAAIERIFFEYAVENVIHLVGLPQIALCEKDPHFSYLLNTQSVHNTLEAMRKTGVQKIVFASSAAVYRLHDKAASEEEEPDPNTVYGYHKYMSEKLIEAYSNSYGVRFIILRLFNVYGQNPQLGKDVISIFLRRAKNGEPLVVEGKKKYRDFVHVKDVTDAFISSISARANNRIINIGTGVKVTLGELVDMMRETFPKIEVEYQKVADDGKGLIADTELCRRLLDLTPTNPYDGIREHIRRYAP
ncbi:MAG: NAD(P)-dependent oxidoreductase [Candidatus Bathyarchaeota archaeon]|nr:NAD(P)-dependent oxidoreductase [Candidatus Bathyarchaeota archaeon]